MGGALFGVQLGNIIFGIVYWPSFYLFIVIVMVLIYKLVRYVQIEEGLLQPIDIPPMKKRDFTLAELRKYDGVQNEDRILIAVNGKVFDVSQGRRIYGPGGRYAVFAGHDASRGLATFRTIVREDGDSLSDLDLSDMEVLKEWEEQLKDRYPIVGKLLKYDETHDFYTEEETTDNCDQPA